MDLVLSSEVITRLEQIIEEELLVNDVEHAFVVDSSGNLIAGSGSLPMHELLPLAAVSAANFSATRRMAQVLGQESFTVLLHKGSSRNIHLVRMDNDLMLVILFSNDVSLGLIRLGSSRATKQLLMALNNEEEEAKCLS